MDLIPMTDILTPRVLQYHKLTTKNTCISSQLKKHNAKESYPVPSTETVSVKHTENLTYISHAQVSNTQRILGRQSIMSYIHNYLLYIHF